MPHISNTIDNKLKPIFQKEGISLRVTLTQINPLGTLFNHLDDYCVLPLLAMLIYVYIYNYI